MEGKCVLESGSARERNINHNSVAIKFKETVVPCTLFPDKAICIHCCLRISQILEALIVPVFIEPGFPSELIEDEIRQHMKNVAEQLPANLQIYYKALPSESKKSWGEIARECGMCPVNTNLMYGDTASIIADEAEPMRY